MVPVIVTRPLVLAKQGVTLDVYSGGRLEPGLEAGWMLEGAQAVARPIDRRWQRLEKTIEILRLAWSSSRPPSKGSEPRPARRRAEVSPAASNRRNVDILHTSALARQPCNGRSRIWPDDGPMDAHDGRARRGRCSNFDSGPP